MSTPKPNKVILSRSQKDVINLLRERMVAIAASMKARQAEVNQIFAETIELYRAEYNVPKDYIFDIEEMAFNSPEAGKDGG